MRRAGAMRPPRKTEMPGESDDLRRSEEHTSELQSQSNLVCRLLLEKKNNSHSSQPAALSVEHTSPAYGSRATLTPASSISCFYVSLSYISLLTYFIVHVLSHVVVSA